MGEVKQSETQAALQEASRKIEDSLTESERGRSVTQDAASPDDYVMVIFGGSGDLCFRKLIPALFMIHERKDEQRPSVNVVAIGRRDWDDQIYRDKAKPWVEQAVHVPFCEEDWQRFAKHLHYYKMDLKQAEDYVALQAYLEQAEAGRRWLFYYAVAPSYFHPITEHVMAAGLNNPGSRMILEKPFGDDLEQAKKLNMDLVKAYGEDGVYHIDHYLGKEMLRNILTVRFQNAIFRQVWQRDAIQDIQINAFEEEGVGTRGGYYDSSGAFRDMVQNHLFQVLSILAIEDPGDESAEALHEAQLRVLRAIEDIPEDEIHQHLVLGQYEGYRQEDKVSEQSTTPTYAALRLTLDLDRWRGVPFYIRTGKKLHKRDTEVLIRFRPSREHLPPDLLVIKIQPEEGIYLRFNIKQPGPKDAMSVAHMDYCQSCNIENYRNTPEAYERLLRAAMQGDASLFTQWDQIEVSWSFANRVLEAWQKDPQSVLESYKPGSYGPEAADRLCQVDALDWINDYVPQTLTNSAE